MYKYYQEVFNSRIYRYLQGPNKRRTILFTARNLNMKNEQIDIEDIWYNKHILYAW
jgi:uncharacterized membrane protein (UPF0182 family)